MRRRTRLPRVGTETPSSNSLHDESLCSHKAAHHLFRDAYAISAQHRVDAPIAITPIIVVKDLGNEVAYGGIFVRERTTHAMIKIGAARQSQLTQKVF